MAKKLTLRHLEVLVKLAVSKEPISYTKFLPDLNPVLDLVEMHFVNKIKDSYDLSQKGEEYLNKLLQYSSRYLENKMTHN